MLTVLGGLAEFERDLIRTRTGEGRARRGALAKHRAEIAGKKGRRRSGDKKVIFRRDGERYVVFLGDIGSALCAVQIMGLGTMSIR
jgi:hypothetical protein